MIIVLKIQCVIAPEANSGCRGYVRWSFCIPKWENSVLSQRVMYSGLLPDNVDGGFTAWILQLLRFVFDFSPVYTPFSGSGLSLVQQALVSSTLKGAKAIVLRGLMQGSISSCFETRFDYVIVAVMKNHLEPLPITVSTLFLSRYMKQVENAWHYTLSLGVLKHFRF